KVGSYGKGDRLAACPRYKVGSYGMGDRLAGGRLFERSCGASGREGASPTSTHAFRKMYCPKAVVLQIPTHQRHPSPHSSSNDILPTEPFPQELNHSRYDNNTPQPSQHIHFLRPPRRGSPS